MLREDQFLKGPVRNVITDRLLSHGTQMEELSFSSDGRLIHLTSRTPDGHLFEEQFSYDQAGRRIRRGAEVVNLNSGGWKEIQALQLDTWSLDQLGALAFGTNGASTAETIFEASGVPIQTIFRDHSGEEVAEIRYEHGPSGRILSAVQSVSGSEYFSVIFERNDRGQIVEQRLLFGGELTDKRSFDYNEFGDKTREVVEDDRGNQHQNKFEYEYEDSWGNWTRQIVHHSLGTDELRRTITYYEN